ncbi:BREX protein BrxB domain-containing protein [Nocardia sp. CA-128927]|uniref:BREX protein BrxB domain-containing protein n=1 Tax=Nocardia sp. CA-128927 TaxID=3239975 RepID=UPI003D970A24
MVRKAEVLTFQERFDHAYLVLSSPNFLQMKGLVNEVPYFILTYAPGDEPRVGAARGRLVTRLRSAGIDVCDIDLWSVATDLWRGTGVLEQILAAESSMPKTTFAEAVGNVVSPSTHLAPRIAEIVHDQVPPPQLLLLSNIGRLFPLVRAHTVLHTLQPLLADRPVVLIFPGSYQQSATQGSALELFDQMTDDDYYRAFDLLDQEVPRC